MKKKIKPVHIESNHLVDKGGINFSISKILLGFWFWITNSNNELARKRLAECAGCEFRKGMTCGLCGCVLQAKARLKEEHCPIYLWE